MSGQPMADSGGSIPENFSGYHDAVCTDYAADLA